MPWKKNYLPNILILIPFLILIFFILLSPGLNPGLKELLYSKQFLYFGTVIDVKFTAESNEQAAEAFAYID